MKQWQDRMEIVLKSTPSGQDRHGFLTSVKKIPSLYATSFCLLAAIVMRLIWLEPGLRPEMTQGVQEACRETQQAGQFRIDNFGMDQAHVGLGLSSPVMAEDRVSPPAPVYASPVRKVDRDEALSNNHKRAALEWLVGALSVLLFGYLVVAQLRQVSTRELREKLRQQQALLDLKRHVEVSEERFRELVESVDAIVWEADAATLEMIFVSQGAERILGFPVGQWLEKPNFWADHLHPQDRERALACERETLEKGKPCAVGYRMMGMDGRFRWFRDSMHVVERPGGNPRLLRGIMVEITKSKDVEEALHESEQRYKDFIAHTKEGVWCVELDPPLPLDLPEDEVLGRFLQNARLVECNFAYARNQGYASPDEVVGKRLVEVIPFLDVDDERMATFRSAVRGKFQNRTAEFRALDKARNLRDYLRTEIPIIENGQLLRIWGTTRDVTEIRRAEQEIRMLKHSIDAHFDGAYWTDSQNRFIYVNEAACRALGYTREELLGMTLSDVNPKATPDRLKQVWEALRSQGFFSIETAHRRKDGSEFPVEVVATYVQFGGAEYVCGFARDITERKEAEAALIEEKHLLHTLMDNLPDNIYFKDRESRFTRVNQAMARSFGLDDPRLAMGKTDFDFFADEHALQAFADEQKVISSGRPMVGMEEKETWPDGHVSWVSTTKMPLRDAHGNIIGTFGISRDVTERKRAEEALRQSESALREALAAAQMGVWEWDQATDTFTWDENLYHIARRDPKLPPPSFREHPQIFTPESWGRLEAAVANALATGARYELDLEMTRPDGSKRWLIGRGEPSRDASGRIIGLRGTAQDITERKRAQEEIRKSEARWRAVFENLAVGIALSDFATTRFLRANLALQKMLGYSEDELRTLSFIDITHEDDREANLRLLRELEDGKRPSFKMQKRYRRKDGEIIWVNLDVSMVPGTESIPRFSLAIVEDITERKRAEEALQGSETRFRTVMEKAPVAISISRAGRTLYVNQRYLEMYGFQSLDEVVGHSVGEQWSPEYRPLVEERARQRALGLPVPTHYEGVGQRRDGSQFPVEIVVATVGLPDGKASIGFLTDITARQRTQEERERSLEQLRALAARLQSIREEERKKVARDIHDQLGQALTALKLDLSSLLREIQDDGRKPMERASSILKLVDEAIQSVRRISTELRPGMLDDLGLVATVEWAGEDFEARTGTKCRLDLPPQDLVVNPEHATAIFRILQETLTNVARHARATEVEVRLARENGFLTLEVHDNGQGIPDDKLSSGKSLGILGMRERALLLGGETTILGSCGNGTRVRVQIPQAPHT